MRLDVLAQCGHEVLARSEAPLLLGSEQPRVDALSCTDGQRSDVPRALRSGEDRQLRQQLAAGLGGTLELFAGLEGFTVAAVGGVGPGAMFRGVERDSAVGDGDRGE